MGRLSRGCRRMGDYLCAARIDAVSRGSSLHSAISTTCPQLRPADMWEEVRMIPQNFRMNSANIG